MIKKVQIVLLIWIVATLQNCSNDYDKASAFANSGNYQAFYDAIREDIDNNRTQAKKLLIDYCFKAIQDGDSKQVEYYLQQYPHLINMTDDEGNRAIDVVLFDEHINIEMLKLLLQYKPDVNYIVHYYDMTPLQVIVSGKYENYEALTLFLDNGADPNYIGISNRSKNTPLMLSYVRDKKTSFSLLLKYKAHYGLANNNIYNAITSSYALYLKTHGVKIRNFYNKKLSVKAKSIIKSLGYRELHNKNMQYLSILKRQREKEQTSSCAPKKLLKWYVKTQEYKALKSLKQHRICKKALLTIDKFS